ncbi:MAG: hypothetical protein KDA81_18925, partial [Planctomycetaceae bacterium]|nr:hypothetical protein [Planctomycetaceae bacterium]
MSLLSIAAVVPMAAADEKPTNEQFPLRGRDVDEPQNSLSESSVQTPFQSISRTRQKSDDPLIQLAQQAVDVTSRRFLSTDRHTPWQMMHALLGLRHEFRILHQGQPINGLDWIAEGQVFDNEYWFEKTRHGGRAHPYSRPYAFEGHANQFVAILSMCGVDLSREFGTGTGKITMRQMIQHAQATITPKDEPTWTLWALSRYLPPSARWRTENGDVYSIERLVSEQTAKPMQGAPCGGTHSLFALAHARNVYLRQGQPLRGVWLQAEYKIRKYINTARMQQNSNGMLSSNYFRGREYDQDVNRRMGSAGHILEFLMIALPQEELNSRWVRMAIEASARDVLNNKQVPIKCSPLYHTVNALNIYLDRVNPAVSPSEPATEDTAAQIADTPKPLSDVDVALKSVPATNISKSNDVSEPSAEGEADVASIEPSADSTMVADTSAPTAAADATVAPADKVDDSLTSLKPAETASTDSDHWKPTAPERRRPIVVADDAGSPSATVDAPQPVKTVSRPIEKSSPVIDGNSVVERVTPEPTPDTPKPRLLPTVDSLPEADVDTETETKPQPAEVPAENNPDPTEPKQEGSTDDEGAAAESTQKSPEVAEQTSSDSPKASEPTETPPIAEPLMVPELQDKDPFDVPADPPEQETVPSIPETSENSEGSNSSEDSPQPHAEPGSVIADPLPVDSTGTDSGNTLRTPSPDNGRLMAVPVLEESPTASESSTAPADDASDTVAGTVPKIPAESVAVETPVSPTEPPSSIDTEVFMDVKLD